MPPAIIILGSINTDLVIRGGRLPAAGETVVGGEFFQAAGGKGANQAVAAARAGAQGVAMLGAVGDDPLGQQALAGLQACGVECRYVKIVSGATSGVALIFVDDFGENMIRVAPGANRNMTPADMDAVDEKLFADARVFLASMELPVETVVAALRRAKQAGLRTILNPAPADVSIAAPEVLRLVDVITPNRGEAAVLAGADTNDDEGISRAAETLCAGGCGACIITLGDAGALVADEGGQTRLPARRVKAIDATAAGDAFNGALAVALAEGRPLRDAARWATAAAAISVTRAGAQPSLPTRREIESTGA